MDAGVLQALGAAIASVRRFGASCHATGWFDTDVLWLDRSVTVAELWRGAFATASWEQVAAFPPG